MSNLVTAVTDTAPLTDPNTDAFVAIRRDDLPPPYRSTFDDLAGLPPLPTLSPSSDALADLAQYVTIAGGVDRKASGLRVVLGLFANVNREHVEHETGALVVWPGDDTIAAGADCSTKSVQRVRAALIDAGIVSPDRSKQWVQATITGPGEPQQPDARTYPTRITLRAASIYAGLILRGAIVAAGAFTRIVRRWVRAATRNRVPGLPPAGRGPVCGSRSILRRRGRSRPDLTRANVDTLADVGACERGHPGRANVDTPDRPGDPHIKKTHATSRELRQTRAAESAPSPAAFPADDDPRPTVVRHDAAALDRPECQVCERPFAPGVWIPTPRICRDCRVVVDGTAS